MEKTGFPRYKIKKLMGMNVGFSICELRGTFQSVTSFHNRKSNVCQPRNIIANHFESFGRFKLKRADTIRLILVFQNTISEAIKQQKEKENV